MLKRLSVWGICFFFVSVTFGVKNNVIYARPHELPKAPGWEYGHVDKITWFQNVGSHEYENETVKVPDKYENQKVLNSWGYKARPFEEIKDLLPEAWYNVFIHPEKWGHFRINETEYVPNTGRIYKMYLEATEKNKGTCSLDKDGWLHNYKAGCPFPELDANDPMIGYKIFWNYNKRLQFNSRQAPANCSVAIDRNHNVRNVFMDSRFLRYNGRFGGKNGAPLYEPNPKNLDVVWVQPYKAPYNLRGILPLIYRYDDPGKDDNMWIYLPSIRRVRRMAASQTQDRLSGGLDMTWDNIEHFSGKTRKVKIHFEGETEVLMPLAASNEVMADSKGWLAGNDQYYQRRKCYKIRGEYKKPILMKDMTLWIDKETYMCCYSVDKDLKGRDWLGQMWFFSWHENGTFTSPNFIGIDFQRNHSSPTCLASQINNLDWKTEMFSMEYLKRNLLAR